MNSTSTYRTSQLHSATTSGFSSSWRNKENTHITHTHTHTNQPRRYQTCQPNWKLVKRTGECLGPVPLTQLCVEPTTTMCMPLSLCTWTYYFSCCIVNVKFFVFFWTPARVPLIFQWPFLTYHPISVPVSPACPRPSSLGPWRAVCPPSPPQSRRWDCFHLLLKREQQQNENQDHDPQHRKRVVWSCSPCEGSTNP